MAEPFDTLMEVQAHDTLLDQLRHRRAALPEHGALAEVEGRTREVVLERDALRGQVDELATRQRALEEQIAAAAARRHELEQRMRSGGINAARDLQAIDAEVHHLADRQASFEEEELALVEEEEPLDEALAASEDLVAELTAEADRLQGAIAAAVEEIDRSIEKELQVRGETAARLPPDLSARYEQLRSRLGGVGAARLVGDRCDGCHLALPSKEVERIRRLPPDEFATCDQCGRILVR